MQKPFCLATDSSRNGIGCVLFQEDEKDGEKIYKPVSFASRVLNKAEKHYAVTEVEALAIVWAFTKFRYYLAGRKTKVYTDHKALEFLMTAKLTHSRLTRWALLLQEYDFEIIYIPGPQNVLADALSRGPLGLEDADEVDLGERRFDAFFIEGVPFENFLRATFEDFGKEQEKDPVWKDIKEKCKQRNNDRISQHYRIHEGVLFFRRHPESQQWVVVMPEELINKLVWHIHLKWGHLGATKCCEKLKESTYFHNMSRRVRRVLEKCKPCQKAKHNNVCTTAPLFAIIPSKLRDLAAVDLFGPLPMTRNGSRYVLVAIELTSKYVTFSPIRCANSKTISRAFARDFLRQVGKVGGVISDNGPQFRSVEWRRMLRRKGIKAIFTSRYHPASNPAERVIKELVKFCRVYCYRQHRRWDVFLNSFQRILNGMPHGSTGLCPELVLHNRRPADTVKDAIEFPPGRRVSHRAVIAMALRNIRKQAQLRKAKQKGIMRPMNLKIGDLVLVRAHHLSNKGKFKTHKFYRTFEGPYRIRKLVHANAVEIEALRSKRSKGIHHVSNLKKWKY